MGSIIRTIPDITDDELIFDDSETRQILKFFWPELSVQIEAIKMNNDLRRFAQTILIAAIEASYAMGFVEATVRATVQPGSGIKSLCNKLARRLTRHWFKHATQRDLMDAKIYVMVRSQIAAALGPKMKAFFEEVAVDQNRKRSLRPMSIARAIIIVRV